MIFEVALALGVGGAAIGLLRALRSLRTRTPAEGSELGKALAAARGRDRGLVSGDVLMIPGEELALGGVVTLDEGGHVLSAFALVGAARDRWLVQLDESGRDLALTSETKEIGEGPVASELPLGGRTLGLERRGTARVEAHGEGVPTLAAQRAPYVVLAERGGRVAIVIDLPGQRLALTGERLDPRVVDRLGGGDVPRS
jgi:hypothetical protein